MKPLHIILLTVSALSVATFWAYHHHSSHRIDPLPAPTYHELFRPGYHFSPPTEWLNDPNGLTFINGKYQLYYQFNPYDVIWGNMSWGHASSTDLVYWENLPVAIEQYNTTDYGLVSIFSGCNIIDVNNTSGLCEEKGCLLAYYTAWSSKNGPLQAQAIAYSNDGGMSYKEYEGNPIINLNLTDFRDPKVFWYEPEEKWIMIVAMPLNASVHLYCSRNLIDWDFMSDYSYGATNLGVWEDPDLYELPIEGTTKWVLAHSVGVDAVQYYIGDFDGTTFTPTETGNTTLLYDYGYDFDEAATWNNEPKGRRLIIGWLDEGAYGGQLPTKVWRGQLSLIREINLRRYPEGLRVVQQPIEEMQKLRDTSFSQSNITLDSKQNNVTLGINGTQLEIIATFAYPTDNIPDEFGFKVFVGHNQSTIVGYNTSNQVLFVDRSDSGLHDFSIGFLNLTSAHLTPDNGTIQLHIFVDSCSVEVFANYGKILMTNLIFPDPTQDKVQVYAKGGSITLESVEAWTLKGIWPEDYDGIKQAKEKDFVPIIN